MCALDMRARLERLGVHIDRFRGALRQLSAASGSRTPAQDLTVAGTHADSRDPTSFSITAIDADSAPMTENTLFRVLSVTKSIGGALTLSLIEDGGAQPRRPGHPLASGNRTSTGARRTRFAAGPHDPASRPITVRHLLPLTCGWGAVPEASPLHAAMTHLGVYSGHLPPRMSSDQFVARVSKLPLAFQPCEGWLYDTGIDLLGVLVMRATGKPLSDLVAERIAAPLNLTATG